MDPIGVYIHIPFCKSKCPYCDFFSGKGSEAEFDRYIKETVGIINYWSQLCEKPVSSVYFGGGTPSVIGSNRLCELLNAVKSGFNVNSDAEITCEINPESGKSIDFEKMRSCGFNRVSIGLQSAVPRELETLGRIHTAQEAKLTTQRAVSAGIDNVSLDLMIAVPFQTVESLKLSIDFCAQCEVKHISSYLLKIERGTKFYSIKEKLKLPDEDMQADLYLAAVDYLGRYGYDQYEISNFAKKGYEGKHNLNYWRCGEYLGIGPSAHSFYEGKRFYYGRNTQDYYNRKIIDDGTGGDSSEYIMLALRLKEGLRFSEYERRYASPVPSDFLRKAEQFSKQDLMELDESRACLTTKGFLVSNIIISELI